MKYTESEKTLSSGFDARPPRRGLTISLGFHPHFHYTIQAS